MASTQASAELGTVSRFSLITPLRTRSDASKRTSLATFRKSFVDEPSTLAEILVMSSFVMPSNDEIVSRMDVKRPDRINEA